MPSHRTFDITIQVRIPTKNTPKSSPEIDAQYGDRFEVWANEMGGLGIGAILEDFEGRISDKDISLTIKEVTDG